MAKKDPICPLLGKACAEHGCRFWLQVQGHNPNTGAQISEWDCAIAWLPVLLIENSQQQRQTGAAVESFRNEMVKDNRSHLAMLAGAAQQMKQLEGRQ